MYRAVLFTLFLTVFSAFANQKEIKSLKEVMTEVLKDKQETLIVFDLDNTLIRTKQSFGSDQWFRRELKVQEAMYAVTKDRADKNKSEAMQVVLDKWRKVQTLTDVGPVENDTADNVRKLQEKFKVMGLTARPVDLAYVTQRQLIKGAGIHLEKNKFPSIDIPLVQTSDYNLKALFTGGILHAGNNDKGPLLLSLIEKLNLNPSKVIFFDDIKANIDNVEGALKKANIDHMCYYYRATKDEVEAFEKNEALHKALEAKSRRFFNLETDVEAVAVKAQ